MSKYGCEAFLRLNKVANELNIPVWLEFGTLLGSYREHSFIPHDDDIDMGMRQEDYTPKFMRAIFNEGFTILRYFTLHDLVHNESRITEITLRYKGLAIDVFFSSDTDDRRVLYSYDGLKPETNIYKVRAFMCPKVERFETIQFEGAPCMVPTNAKECLEYLYGPTFMIPDLNWHDREELILPDCDYYGYMIGGW